MMQKPKILAADNTKVALRYMETILGDIYDVICLEWMATKFSAG